MKYEHYRRKYLTERQSIVEDFSNKIQNKQGIKSVVQGSLTRGWTSDVESTRVQTTVHNFSMIP